MAKNYVSASYELRGGMMHVVTVVPAAINYADILEAVEFEPDDYAEPPWEDCDGYEHEVTHKGSTYSDDDQVTERRGYFRQGWHNCGLIQLTSKLLDSFEKDYLYYRAMGYAKQPARAEVDRIRRDVLDRLVKWYEQGWEVYCGVCDFVRARPELRLPGSCCTSLSGIYEPDESHLEETRHELAGEVAHALKQLGFVIENEREYDVERRYRSVNRPPDRPWTGRIYHVDLFKLRDLRAAWLPRLRAAAVRSPGLSPYIMGGMFDGEEEGQEEGQDPGVGG